MIQTLPHFLPDALTRLHIANNVSQFPRVRQPLADLRPAAVALIVVKYDDECALLLTRRTSSLRAHSGQWALPGGRMDEGETASEAALREVREEINLTLQPESVMGTLDDYITRSGYRITPVILWAGANTSTLEPNPDEVASIHRISFTALARADAPQFDMSPDSDQEILSMKLSVDQIYAPTAAFLYQFREVVIKGRETRVLHYDQPRFAWR
ncbi:MAG: CoA pyrophosphatase [Proteobacteria bacterium]|nr:CoA pyrophosphatase [Pseudomonadota bacterium]